MIISLVLDLLLGTVETIRRNEDWDLRFEKPQREVSQYGFAQQKALCYCFLLSWSEGS